MKFISLLLATTAFFLANPAAKAAEGTSLSISMSELTTSLERHGIEVRYPMWLLFNSEGQLVEVVQDDKESGYRSRSFNSDDWSSTPQPSGLSLSDFPAGFSTDAMPNYNSAYLFVIDHPLCSACTDELENLQLLAEKSEDSTRFAAVTVELK